MTFESELDDAAETLRVPEAQEINLDMAVRLTDKMSAYERKMQLFAKWFETEKLRTEKQQAFITSCCEAFMQNYTKETGEKSLVLPNGYKLSFRKKTDGIEVLDEKAALAWLEINLIDACSIKTSILKKKVAEYYKTTGELPPGIKYREAGDGDLSFSISKGG